MYGIDLRYAFVYPQLPLETQHHLLRAALCFYHSHFSSLALLPTCTILSSAIRTFAPWGTMNLQGAVASLAYLVH